MLFKLFVRSCFFKPLAGACVSAGFPADAGIIAPSGAKAREIPPASASFLQVRSVNMDEMRKRLIQAMGDMRSANLWPRTGIPDSTVGS